MIKENLNTVVSFPASTVYSVSLHKEWLWVSVVTALCRKKISW